MLIVYVASCALNFYQVEVRIFFKTYGTIFVRIMRLCDFDL